MDILSSSRREFLAGLTAAGVSAAMPASGSRIKVGCCSWCFHDFSPGRNPEEAIGIIGGIGFDGIELIVLGRKDLQDYWAGANLDRVRKLLDKNHLQVSQFVLFQPVVEDLSSRDLAARGRSLDIFENGCKVAKQLNAPIVNIVAPWARELKGPTEYLPRYYEIADPKPGEKFHIDIDPSFDWDAVWQNYVGATKECLVRAKHYGLKMSIEQHTHTIIPEAASFLRLWDAVHDPALGCNLDAGWAQLGREYPPVAIYKLKSHLMNLHLRDIDGKMRAFPNIGQGVMDFKGIADALKATGFEGYATIEQDKYGDMQATCKRYHDMMRQYLA